MSAEGNRRQLTSWKAIAAYLDRDARTVMRWSQDRGLPVHRVPGGQRGGVFAFTDELDAWRLGSAATVIEHPPARDWKPATAAVLVILGVAVGWWMWMPRNEQPVSVDIHGRSVVGLGASGQPIWNVDLGASDAPGTLARLADLDADGAPDVIASVNRSAAQGGQPSELVRLDARGRRLWTRTVDDAVTFGATTYAAPWIPSDVAAYRSASGAVIAWALRHHTWWPGLVVVMTPDGRRAHTFVHAGWVQSLASTPDGRHLVAGGISNAHDGAALLVLDGNGQSGTSPGSGTQEFDCGTCPAGRPLRYFVVPWTDIVDRHALGNRKTLVEITPQGTVQMRVVQSGNADVIVEFASDFSVTRSAVSDGYWAMHADLERTGRLDHSRDTCPFRDGPAVREIK